MSNDLPSAQRMWSLAKQAIEFEAGTPSKHHEIAESITKLPLVEQRFFQSALDYDGAIDYQAAVRGKVSRAPLVHQQWMFDRVGRMERQSRDGIER
jgi:hypothetical protein